MKKIVGIPARLGSSRFPGKPLCKILDFTMIEHCYLRSKLSNDINFDFYTKIKLNYLLSTFQLNEACNFKEELNSNVRLDFFFLEI